MCSRFGIELQNGVLEVNCVGIDMQYCSVSAQIKEAGTVCIFQIESCLIADARAFSESEIRCAAFIKAAVPITYL